MDILMSETCWANNKWNKIASGFKLVFHSSTKNKSPALHWNINYFCEYLIGSVPYHHEDRHTLIGLILSTRKYCRNRKLFFFPIESQDSNKIGIKTFDTLTATQQGRRHLTWTFHTGKQCKVCKCRLSYLLTPVHWIWFRWTRCNDTRKEIS